MTKLKDFPTTAPATVSKQECDDALNTFHKKLFELQNVFYANGRLALLIIFQGVDTSGKDGTIRHVLMCMNPMGIQVKSFKQPTEEEMKHDFLWRIYPHFPTKGMLAVFNRSYYEDILVPSVEDNLSKEEIHHRYQLINRLEKHLELSDTHVIKFFLHISKEEQEKRIKERLTMVRKRWKYAKEDEASTRKWDDYMAVYDMIINKCDKVPWHIIPADQRWYRNYTVAKVITEHLELLHLKYPGE